MKAEFLNFKNKRILHSGNGKIQLYNSKEECCGCTACYAICPQKAIAMVEDEEGFEYPVLDEEKCIECNSCIKICPFKLKL